MKKKIFMITTALVIALALLVIPSLPFTHVDNSADDFSLIELGNKNILSIAHEIFSPEGALAAADYTCDGVADDVQFQSAINALPASGGKLLVYSGNYQFTATVSRAIDDVTIQGVGRATYFGWNGASALFSAGNQDSWIFRDFATDAGGLTLTNATDYKLENVYLGSTDYNYVRGATFVVASSTASAEYRAQADYICDGTADEVEINAAIQALPGQGGKVLLSEGIFYLAAPIVIDRRMTLEGQGHSSTSLTMANNADCNAIQGSGAISDGQFRSFSINGNKANQASGHGVNATNLHNWQWYDISITSVKQHGIYVTGVITRTWWLTHVSIGSCDGDGMYLSGFYGMYAYGLYSLSNGSDGITVVSGGDLLISESGFSENGQYGLNLNSIGNAQLIGVVTGGNTSHGIYLSGTSESVQFTSCRHYDNGGDGLRTAGTLTNIIINGGISQDNLGGASYGYYLGGTAIRCYITGAISEGNDNDWTIGAGWIVRGNSGWIAPGEIRSVSGSLTAGNANAICFAWNNPELQDILIKKVVIEVTTAGGVAGSHLDVGIADDATGTNRGTEFYDDLDLDAVQINDSWVGGDGGTQTKWVFCQDSASAVDDWIVGQILDANAGALVGEYYIEYVGR